MPTLRLAADGAVVDEKRRRKDTKGRTYSDLQLDKESMKDPQKVQEFLTSALKDYNAKLAKTPIEADLLKQALDKEHEREAVEARTKAEKEQEEQEEKKNPQGPPPATPDPPPGRPPTFRNTRNTRTPPGPPPGDPPTPPTQSPPPPLSPLTPPGKSPLPKKLSFRIPQTPAEEAASRAAAAQYVLPKGTPGAAPSEKDIIDTARRAAGKRPREESDEEKTPSLKAPVVHEHKDEDVNDLMPGEANMNFEPDEQVLVGAGGNVMLPAPPAGRINIQVEGPKPAQPIQGFLGKRNLENEDITKASIQGFNADVTNTGDAITKEKATANAAQDTLRPMFGMANPISVIPKPVDQIKSDLLFEDFSIVAPGNGLGITNKMFLMEEARKKFLEFRAPLAEPRPYDGPTMTVETTPLQWQNEITRKDRQRFARIQDRLERIGAYVEQRAGRGSLNILADDYGEMRKVSAKGLARAPESPLEPVHRMPGAMERVKPLTGQQLQAQEFRRLFDAERYPQRLQPFMAQSGGATISTRRGLALLPFPIGCA